MASAQARADTPAEGGRGHAVAVLGLVEVPSDDPVSEIYGTHPGIAGRYVYRGGERWSVALDLGYRGPGGQTPGFALDAELSVLQVGGMARWHPQVGGPDAALDFWLGGGLVFQWIEERVGFPDGPLESDEQAAGWAIGAGIERLLGRRWGVLADVRFSRISVASELEGIEETQLGGLGVSGGVFVAF